MRGANPSPTLGAVGGNRARKPGRQSPGAIGNHMGSLKKFIGPMVLTIVTLFVINRVKVIRDLVYPAA